MARGAGTVAYYSDSCTFGGAEQSLLTLLGGLDRAQWRPVLVDGSPLHASQLSQQATSLGVEVRRVPVETAAPTLRGRIAHLVRLTSCLRSVAPDIVHANLTWPLGCRVALTAAQMARVRRVVATVHSCDVQPGYRARLARALSNRCVVAYIAVSAEVARRLVRRLRVSPASIQVIYNGVHVPPSAAAADEPRSRSAVILALARLERQKGLDDLLRACASLPHAELRLAGDGPARTELEMLAHSLGIAQRVAFLGHRSDVRQLLNACDVLALPSLDEGFPLAVLEAMAASRPVVATAVGGIPEAIMDGVQGLLVPAGDPAALAGALRKIVEHPALAAQMGRAGRERVEREFSAQAMAHGISAVYERVCA